MSSNEKVAALTDEQLEDIYGWAGYTMGRFKREVRAILAAQSADARNGEGVALKPFAEAWAEMEAQGYQYGGGALENAVQTLFSL